MRADRNKSTEAPDSSYETQILKITVLLMFEKTLTISAENQKLLKIRQELFNTVIKVKNSMNSFITRLDSDEKYISRKY